MGRSDLVKSLKTVKKKILKLINMHPWSTDFIHPRYIGCTCLRNEGNFFHFFATFSFFQIHYQRMPFCLGPISREIGIKFFLHLVLRASPWKFFDLVDITVLPM